MTDSQARAPLLTLRLLGPFQPFVEGEPLPRTRTRKGTQILALLALRGGAAIDRGWLAGTLWPEQPRSQALSLMRRELTDLRRALGTASVCVTAPTPRTLGLEDGVAIDLHRFEQAIARGDGAGLREVVALYHGPLLDGWTEEWAAEPRRDAEQRYLQALETLADLALAEQEPRAAEGYLQRVVLRDPAREAAQRALMRLLATRGQVAAALQLYRDLREWLYRELHAEPDPETTALYRELRAPAAPRVPAPPRPFPASPSLPRPLTRFIGRDRERDAVRELVMQHRMVTLTGAGGSGKTRLALQVAGEVAPSFPDGVWWVELASLSDPERVWQMVATVVGVRQRSGVDWSRSIIDDLRDRSALLVLDNVEHLVEPCAEIADRLLQACPELRLLVTGRECLALGGEQLYRVPSLPVPEAVALFCDRAALADPAFCLTDGNAAAVVQICRETDGMPLAIELAAARVKALPVERIAAGLGQLLSLLTRGSRAVTPRHQTLRASIDWSYALLSEAEQRLLRHLSVFVGGWTPDAAEAVATDDVRDHLTSLVE